METTKAVSAYIAKLNKVLLALDPKVVSQAIQLISDAWLAGKQIITMGNGGSALVALHVVNDWSKSLFMAKKIPFRGRSLVDNLALLMSYANDVSFEDVFIAQLENIMMPGDLVIAISGSGNSENIIRGVNYANDNGGVTLGLCGYRGGRLKQAAQHVIWVDYDDMQIAEDVFAIFGHIVMQRLCGII